ncbi:MAG: HDIG domain-containing protein [Spirochaetaceae bacterium]|jgi:putative nucleotidyltransferase with HDIG domain|nr:HDIG domain-containing protein [Spirochaetaceae bacterium]
MAGNLSRNEAYALLERYVTGETLLRHSLTVEAAMRHWAELLGEDPEWWGVVGLLHDIDFEQFPEQHCVKAKELLEIEGVDPDIIHAVQSHGWGLVCDIRPEHRMEQVLYTIDELTGLIFACALMRPSRSVLDLETKSVLKKFKTPAFAAGCNREVISSGAEMLGLELPSVIEETILGMRKSAAEIGLGGV